MCGQQFGQVVPKYEGPTSLSAIQLDSLVILTGSSYSLSGNPARQMQACATWDLTSPEWSWKTYAPSAEQAVWRSVDSRVQSRHTLRHKFSAISCGPDGIFLQSSSRNWWRLSFD